MYSDFQEILSTVEDRNTLLEEISVVSQVPFFTDPKKQQEVLNQSVRAESREMWQQFLEKHKNEEINWSQFRQELTSLPVLELQVAIEPTTEFIQQLVQKVQTLTDQSGILLQIHYQPKLLGGVSLIFDGKIKDYSIQKKLTEYLQTHADEVQKLWAASDQK